MDDIENESSSDDYEEITKNDQLFVELKEYCLEYHLPLFNHPDAYQIINNF